MAKKKSTKRNTANRNARIETSTSSRTGKIRTETTRRDDGSLEAAMSTNPKTNRSSFYIGVPGAGLHLSGRQARTVFRVLQRHYDEMSYLNSRWFAF